LLKLMPKKQKKKLRRLREKLKRPKLWLIRRLKLP